MHRRQFDGSLTALALPGRAKGVATEGWNVKVRLDSVDANSGASGTQNVDGTITRRFVTWDREAWPFALPSDSASSLQMSEVPTALALCRHGFMVFEQATVVPVVLEETKTTTSAKSPTKKSQKGASDAKTMSSELVWISAHAPGVPVQDHITSEFLADVQSTRKCFFPEKVRIG